MRRVIRGLRPSRAWALTVVLAAAIGCSGDDGPATDSEPQDPGFATAGTPATAGTGAVAFSPTAGGAPTATGEAPAAAGSDAPAAGGMGGGEAPATPGEPGADSAGDGAGETADAGPTPTRATGPGDWGPGDYPPDPTMPTYLEIAGVPGQMGPRQYKVHVPPSYDPNVPMPVVFCIHGLAQDPVMFCVVGAGWIDTADQHDFVLIMPNGYQNSWNGGTCCGGASASQLDDVALFRALLDEVGSHVNIDLDRVYATGLSNGGYMSYRLACDAADVFAAVAPGAGAVGINTIGGGTNPASDFTRCEPSEPVAVLDIHGTADFLVPYTLQEPSLSAVADSAGCDAAPRAAERPASGGDTQCVTYDGCLGGIEVTGCSVEGGGHCWFGSEDCGTGGGAIGAAFVGANSNTMDNNAAIVEFFERNAR